jgi:hypothetical protein
MEYTLRDLIRERQEWAVRNEQRLKEHQEGITFFYMLKASLMITLIVCVIKYASPIKDILLSLF